MPENLKALITPLSARPCPATDVGHLSDVSLSIVGAVVDVLDTAVREVGRVGALSGSSAVVIVSD